MSEWREYRFDEVANIVDCEHKTAPTIEKSDFYSVRTTNISRGKIDFDNCNRVDKEVYLQWIKRATPEAGDIILAREAPVGEVGMIKDGYKVCLGQRTVLIKLTSSEINNHYLLYYLVNPANKNELIEMSGGSVVSHLNMKDIRAHKLKVHTLPEQKAIAEVLSSLDDKIDLLHRQNKTLEQMAETLFRQWFVEEAGEDWEEKPLSKCVDIAIGRTPPRKQKQWFSTNDKDIKWVSIKDMGDSGIFIFDTSEYLTAEAVNNFNIPVIPIDTVVLSFKMTLGRVGITSEEMLSNEAIAHFKFNNETPFSKEYLYLFLKTYPYQTLGSTSSIVTSINSTMIKELTISIPDEETLFVFKEQVRDSFLKIKENQKQIRTLESLRDTLLPKLMSGEVRIASHG